MLTVIGESPLGIVNLVEDKNDYTLLYQLRDASPSLCIHFFNVRRYLLLPVELWNVVINIC